MSAPPVATVVFSCGHEAERGRAVPQLGGGEVSAPAGRALSAVVTRAMRADGRPVCVVPMTLGRDPRLIADSARALRWLVGTRTDAGVALADPFGTADHLIGWLRAAALRAATRDDPHGALLITAPAAGPFDDAELFRIARLVQQYGCQRWVEVALLGGDPDLDAGIERCVRLGAERVALIPAWFGTTVSAHPQAVNGGPLLAPAAVRGVVSARVAAALARFDRGDNGIASGLDAEHGHGYAHTHTHTTTPTHTHTHHHHGH